MISVSQGDRASLRHLPNFPFLKGVVNGLTTIGLGNVYQSDDGKAEAGEAFFILICGEPSTTFIEELLGVHQNETYFIPESSDWIPVIQECASSRGFELCSRYSFELCNKFDSISDPLSLPDGYVGQWLSFEETRKAAEQITPHLQNDYWSRELWENHGFAYGIKRDDKFACAASSFVAGKKIHEIEIATDEEHRRLGLATFAAEKFLVKLTSSGQVASWDAVSQVSKKMAMKLGFGFREDYLAIKVSQVH